MERHNSSRVSYDDIVALDEILRGLNLRRCSVMNDGNTFYSAVSHQLTLIDNPISPESVRMRAIRYLRQHTQIDEFQWFDAVTSGESKQSYLSRHSCNDEPADDIMIQATASSLDYVINIITLEEAIQFVSVTMDNTKELIVGRVDRSNYFSVEGEYVITSKLNLRVLKFSDHVTSRGILKQTTLPSFSDESSTISPVDENGKKKVIIGCYSFYYRLTVNNQLSCSLFGFFQVRSVSQFRKLSQHQDILLILGSDNDQMTSQHTMQQGPGLNPIDDEYTDEFLDGEEEPL